MSCHTADSKPVKQEVNGTAILPPLVFPAPQILVSGEKLAKSEDGRTHPLKVSQKLMIIFGEIKKLRHDTKQNDTHQNTTIHYKTHNNNLHYGI